MSTRRPPPPPPDAPAIRAPALLFDRECVLGPLLLLPAVIYIVALVGFPLVLAILYSFSDVTVGDQSIDLGRLRELRATSSTTGTFRTALRNIVPLRHRLAGRS